MQVASLLQSSPSKPGLQKHTPYLHEPRPVQPLRHDTSRLQSGPSCPGWQWHSPALHTPCALHRRTTPVSGLV